MTNKIYGKEISELPKDLYIPPDAMRVILEIFEGPLDLLLYLIRKNNLNIIEISVASITKQYIDYVDYMQCINLDLAADYLEMAAILAEIKSKMLLPVLPTEQEEQEDPRAELVRKLQEYQQIKQAAEKLDLIPRQERDFFIVELNDLNQEILKKKPEIKLNELLMALQQILNRQLLNQAHVVLEENLSVRDKKTAILKTLKTLQKTIETDNSGMLNRLGFVLFSNFFDFKEGKLGIIVNFLALLELVKENLLEITQRDHFLPIYVKLT